MKTYYISELSIYCDAVDVIPPGAIALSDNQAAEINAALLAGWSLALGEGDALYTLVPPEPAPPHRIFAKLAVRRACRALGYEGQLNALIAASPEFAADWADAAEVDLDDPVLLFALSIGQFTEGMIEEIIKQISGE